MPETMVKETLTYTLEELEEMDLSAYRKAYYSWMEGAADYGWWEYSLEYFAEIGNLLGFHMEPRDIHFSLSYSQGDYCSFSANYYHEKGGFAKLRKQYLSDADQELTYIMRDLATLQRPFFWDISANISENHRGNMSVSYVETANFYFWDSLTDVDEEIRDLARRFAQWMYSKLREEYEYLTSEEMFKERAEEEEMRFEESGKIYW